MPEDQEAEEILEYPGKDGLRTWSSGMDQKDEASLFR